MKLSTCRWIILVCLLIMPPLRAGAANSQIIVLVEAEDFQFKGGWAVGSARQEAVDKFLMAAAEPAKPRPAPAATAIRIPAAGEYAVWVRSRDYASQAPRSRRYRVAIDGAALPGEGGRHGKEGWAWENLGRVALQGGEHLLELRFVSSFSRCDRIVLTTRGDDPTKWPESRQRQLRVEPLRIETAPPAAPGAATTSAAARRTVARLENECLRVRFEEAKAGAESRITKTAEIRLGDGSWAPLPQFGAGEKLFVLHAAESGLMFPPAKPIHPAWSPKVRTIKVTVGGKAYDVHPGATDNPFEAAESEPLEPRTARQVAPGEVEVGYVTPQGLEATGRWTLAPGAHDVRFSLTLTPPREGYYSIGLCAFAGMSREAVRFVELPPLFQFQRLPESPVLVSTAVTPQPYALMQACPDGRNEIGLALVAEPERLPFVWPTIRNAPYGFSLLNAARQVQPCGFSPVLGFEGSRWAAGKAQTVAWRLFAAPGDWKASLERLSAEVMELKDYRRPLRASLTEAALNMIDLMMNPEHGGWDAEMKGFYDIETQAMSKQAAPLTLLAAAALTRDERFFKERALPTLEFTLSRRRADIINPALGDKSSERDKPKMTGQLNVPTMAYGTTYWQGAYELLGRLNPWLEEFILPGGEVAGGKRYGAPAQFVEWLAAWRYKPDPAYLQNARRMADDFLRQGVYGRQTTPVDWSAFYNISFYPQWWNLLDLYEATGEARYRDAAEQGAFHTIAGLWSHPRVPEGDVLIHAGGEANGIVHIWHRNDQLYRLGWPRKAGDTPERKVPAWTVAQTGLGLEQPSTYVANGIRESGMRNIMNATWAPHLMRAFAATGRDIYRTYARNAVIGRYATYPGYYLNLFTDLVRDPQYPMHGPDLTSFYYHHIPVHLGFTLDYLVTEAGARSGGRVKFPYVTQKDYAWFNFRVYGQMPGEVFGDKAAVLWLDRAIAPCRAAEVDWLAARSPERVHLMLMNQLHEPLTVPLTLDSARLGLKRNAPGKMVVSGAGEAKATEQTVAWEKLDKLTIPPLGMATLSLPAERREAFPQAAPLKQGHAKRDLGGPWGELHAFRIRSPFGSDALYVVLTGEPPQGARATLELEGSAPQKLVRERFPYEFSVYPLPQAEEMKFRVRMEAPGGAPAQAVAQDVEMRMGNQ